MTKQLTRTALGLALGLFAAAVPGYCGNITASLTGSGGTIDVSGSGSSSILQAFSVSYTGMTLFNPGFDGSFTLTNVLLKYALVGGNGTLTLSLGSGGSISGGAAFSNMAALAPTNLLQATITGGIPFNASLPAGSFDVSGGAVNVEFGATTSLTSSATFVSDLAESMITTVFGGGLVSTGAGAVQGTSGNNNCENSSTTCTQWTAGSDTFSFTATPEPASLFMLGSGLLALGFFGRKRLVRS